MNYCLKYGLVIILIIISIGTLNFSILTMKDFVNISSLSIFVIRTLSLISKFMTDELSMLSNIKSVTSSKECASVSSITVPLRMKLRSSNKACRDSVATCGLDHRFPPSSTSSSNFIHLKKKIHLYYWQTTGQFEYFTTVIRKFNFLSCFCFQNYEYMDTLLIYYRNIFVKLKHNINLSTFHFNYTRY